MRVACVIFLAVCCMTFLVPRASADPPQARTTSEVAAPEQLPAGAYWLPGILGGGLVGLGGGYLQEREGEEPLSGRKWRKIGIWGGSGAAAGLVVGLMFYAADRNDEQRGQQAYRVVRDIVSGTIVGTVVGGSAGVIYDGAADDSGHALYGASLGAVIGAGLGFMAALIELPSTDKRSRVSRFTPTLTSTRDGRNRPTWLMGASGRF